jgi:hypothetical protein
VMSISDSDSSPRRALRRRRNEWFVKNRSTSANSVDVRKNPWQLTAVVYIGA